MLVLSWPVSAGPRLQFDAPHQWRFLWLAQKGISTVLFVDVLLKASKLHFWTQKPELGLCGTGPHTVKIITWGIERKLEMGRGA